MNYEIVTQNVIWHILRVIFISYNKIERYVISSIFLNKEPYTYPVQGET